MSRPMQVSLALPLPRLSSTSVKLESTAPLMAVVPEIRLEHIVGILFPQMVDQQNGDACLSARRFSTDRSR